MRQLARRLAREQHGFTMIAVMGALLVVLLMSAAAFAAANGDIRIAGYNGEQKRAYAAAEAGVADYLYHLNQNPSYWSLCTDVPAPDGQPFAPVNQPWNGTGTDPRVWRSLSESAAGYTIELLPAKGDSCDKNDADGSMLDSSGTFRIRATGRTSESSKVRRSIIATFKPSSFLDYLYFTERESQDPVVWTKLNSCGGTPGSERTPDCFATRGKLLSGGLRGPDLAAWGADQCSKYWRPAGTKGNRGDEAFPGQIYYDGSWSSYPVKCTEIIFGQSERIEGPFHTNDGIDVCDDPTFGRDASDRIEVSARANVTPDEEPYRASPNCSANPDFVGTWAPGAPELDPPQTNSKLKKDAAYLFRGGTRIVLNADGTMTVSNQNQSPRTQTFQQPADGVIYAEASSCEAPYDPYLPKVYDPTTSATASATATGCGSVYVEGTYTRNITIAADEDIVVTNDLQRGGDVLLGLVANNFVRVAHPSSFSSSGTAGWTSIGGGPKCANNGTPTGNIIIEAAILALNRSFMVDRYGCGGSLGKLNVVGAIAQKYRGPVGVGNGTTGFTKNYKYDNRLRFRSPPKFIKPENAAWNVARQVEQSPAR
jgi:hypothetical protein